MARELVWHAAQIIAIVNDYSVAVPSEIFRVCVAYTFIVAFVRYGTFDSLLPYANTVVKLDQVEYNLSQKAALDSWIEDGGFASIGSAVDINNHSAVQHLRHDAETLLGRFSQWNLAKRLVDMMQTSCIFNDTLEERAGLVIHY